MQKRAKPKTVEEVDEQRLFLLLAGVYLVPGVILSLCGHFGGGALLMALSASVLISKGSNKCSIEDSRPKSWTDCCRKPPENGDQDKPS